MFKQHGLLRGFLTSAVTAAFLFPCGVPAQEQPEDEEMMESVVTTGFRVSQGGAQDINFFRGEVAFARIPHPDTLTAEGLMSEHDIVFAGTDSCRQLFCLTGEASRADLIAVPGARYLAGVGFATNLDEKKWRRARLNLVAVVDKSGSMDGEPLELVRQSLTILANQLRPGDQMTIVLYGDTAHVHLPTTGATRFGVDIILESIARIRSEGSTSMEAGLTLGYDIAEASAPAFKGVTRVMLFTDERPNTMRPMPKVSWAWQRTLPTEASASPPSASACNSVLSSPRKSAACGAAISTSSATRPTSRRCSPDSSTTW